VKRSTETFLHMTGMEHESIRACNHS